MVITAALMSLSDNSNTWVTLWLVSADHIYSRNLPDFPVLHKPGNLYPGHFDLVL